MIDPGIYEAKIVGYGILKTKSKGEPQPSIVFNVTDSGGKVHRVFWQSGLNSEKGIDITLKALKVCGLKSADDIWKMAGNIESGILNADQPVQVTIEHEADERDPMKVYPKVRWINEQGSMGGGREFVSEEEARRMMASVNLRGAWKQIAGNKEPSSLDPIPF